MSPQSSGVSTTLATPPASDEAAWALSDAFWTRNSEFAPTAYRYNSLADITADADLIILGRVVGTRDGVLQPFGAKALRKATFGIIAVDDVLKGVPETQAPGTVLVARLGEPGQRLRDIPTGEVLMFLMHYPRMRTELGVAQSVDPNDRFFYARPNGYQCVLRNIGGVVRIPHGPDGWEAALGPFPAPLEGMQFADVLNEVRENSSSD